MIFNNIYKRLLSGEKIGITSICTANNFVIEAAMIHAKKNNYELLIESTSNQVDQFGGYTGFTPDKFFEYVSTIAKNIDFPLDNLILGGDHLGPNVWKSYSSDTAMKNSFDQVKSYVSAGYQKIHLDTSFVLGDDKSSDGILSPEVITERAAQLCEVAEKTSHKLNNQNKPVYIIGTDVPIPGGAIEDEKDIRLTTDDELEETVILTKNAFYKRGLEEAWERVIAVVVQPGVEFTDTKIFPYVAEQNNELIKKIENYKGLYFEAHSTDYQRKIDLKNMVNDHFAILKVGPWLTFAMREALFALAFIENEMLKFKKDLISSDLLNILKFELGKNPKHWKNHYKGDENTIHLAKNFSYSDRIRYYWSIPAIIKSVNRLINNLEKIDIPESLVSQFLPIQYWEMREGKIEKNPRKFILSKITEILSIYYSVTGGNNEK